jgi:NAD(P)-dependent dehydrogenase (short-subunit alcohol dehydrogenase family)
MKDRTIAVIAGTCPTRYRMSTLLVTGSSGLIGSEVVDYFCQRGWEVHGIDNNIP